MLFPDEHGPDTCLREMARIPSGEPVTKPHVTVAYLTVPTITGRQLAQLSALAGPAVPIRAAAPFGFREDADPVFGHTLSLRIAPHPAFEWWRRAVRATIDPHGAMPEPGNLAFVPHLTAVRRLAVPPAEALTRPSSSWPPRSSSRSASGRRTRDAWCTASRRQTVRVPRRARGVPPVACTARARHWRGDRYRRGDEQCAPRSSAASSAVC